MISDSCKTGSAAGSNVSRSALHDAQINNLLKDRDGSIPIWIRSPKGRLEHYTGLSRAKLYELAGEGLIRSVSLRKPGEVKGTRLFNLQSILRYIEGLETGNSSKGVAHV